MSQGRKPEFWFAPSFRCYSFESCFHGWRFFSLHRRPHPPIEWSPCFPRTTQLPLAASPCSRLSRPQSVGSEVAHRVSLTLATVRRSNRACRFPAHGFHEDSCFRDAIEGINPTRL